MKTQSLLCKNFQEFSKGEKIYEYNSILNYEFKIMAKPSKKKLRTKYYIEFFCEFNFFSPITFFRIPMLKDLEEILYDEQTIQNRVKELASELTKEYKGKNPVMVCVLTGSIFFFTDLCKSLDFAIDPDYIICSSYNGTQSSGNLKITKDLKANIEGRHVIVVEDIIDSGLTMYQLRHNLLTRNPASLKICVLCDKNVKKKFEVPIDYCGFHVVDKFIVGYGFDYNNKYRNMPVIGVLKKDIYSIH
ncbi:Hypoxanthine-guanine-xanthine phosphoribosyltransferase [Tritrichomonas foetus]|uniref:Hypoxanthine phosphoribosyltransferase n=1 Tax=Tritrichomonas foetus TaxID=1144522 RepID=A0A1J4J3G6_9EUKA|nr:Hypoxanthine-guanine-xanthine phosphoribosyltransferase [Tritrichomonas foetus]|eukprot:OHS93966.1 Hypoxanthine-guanine-xanthine phosphoribosyltransferase [Tritrichomonas foetus]